MRESGGCPIEFPPLSQNISAATQSNATDAASTSGNSAVAQAFAQLGNDLQSGNLQRAQQDFTNLQQDLTQISSHKAAGYQGHHRHYTESSQSSSSSSQQTDPISQAFNTLAQGLQAGNLSGAQSGFSALQNDLHQIGGFLTAGSPGTSSTAVPPSNGSLNVTARFPVVLSKITHTR